MARGGDARERGPPQPARSQLELTHVRRITDRPLLTELNDNQLSGQLPPAWMNDADWTKCRKLKELFLEKNAVSVMPMEELEKTWKD